LAAGQTPENFTAADDGIHHSEWVDPSRCWYQREGRDMYISTTADITWFRVRTDLKRERIYFPLFLNLLQDVGKTIQVRSSFIIENWA
jgi:hypothetical protein